MDRRTKNRIAEHAPHGWQAQRTKRLALFDNELATLMKCPCGWLGWILEEYI